MREISADVDGCIRRKCTECGKHFASSIKQRQQQDTYWCPYCGQERTWDRWFTAAQQAYFEDALAEDALALVDQELDEALTELARTSEGVIQYHPYRTLLPPRTPLSEPTVDLVLALVACHPGGKLKIEPGWSKPVRCHLCGAEAQSKRAVLGKLRLRPAES
jgi:hypothetical protein